MSGSWEQSATVTLPNGKPVIGPYVGRIIETLCERMIPDGGKLPVGLADTDSYVFLARYLRDQDAGARIGLKTLFILFDLAPILFIGRARRFVNLNTSEQELYLYDWAASRIYYRRMAVVLLKTLTGMGFYNDPKVLEQLGFEFPCGTR
jgi:hypothetical protein